MTRTQFLAALESGLARLPDDERARSVAFYEEMIADRMEDGLSEEAAVAGMEPPEEIAGRILAESGAPPFLPGKLGPGKTALLILGAPLWLPLVIAAAAVAVALFIALAAVAFSLLATLWAVWISVAAACFGLILGGAATALVISFGVAATWAGGLMQFGAGLFSAGLGLILIPATRKLTAVAIEATKWMLNKAGSLFRRNGGTMT